MKKPTKRRRPKKRRPDFFIKNRVLFVLLGIAGLCLAGLIWLARLEEPPPPSVVPQVAKPPMDHIQQVHAEVEAFLARFNVETANVQRELAHQPARYTLESDLPPSELVADFRNRLQQIPGGYSLEFREANSLVVEKSRRVQIIIHFLPPAPVIPEGPLMAIIMDDLGRSSHAARVLIAMPQQVTFAVLPDEPQAAKVAEMAHAAGREVMLHAPMEPQGYPAVNPGRDALLVRHSDVEIRRNFDLLLARIPHVAGVNNHMGSRFTEVVTALTPVMESLQEKGLFFIDSMTTGDSRGAEVARRFGVPVMSRDVFLDNVAEVEAIARELRNLEDKARSKGMAIGICHPYPETLEALKRELPGIEARGIKLVPVSVLLRKQLKNQGS